ncbi:uncharacterized protein LOC117186143 [Drosophila miranda]|uniref:uncharacterized protein LOC117186143 n=1 Tax=Drosophila miranda TaxID=7229 RepID=UPI00143F7191|nr:uncharacterized protein LOC117186143 [Drosophila miranda]
MYSSLSNLTSLLDLLQKRKGDLNIKSFYLKDCSLDTVFHNALRTEQIDNVAANIEEFHGLVYRIRENRGSRFELSKKKINPLRRTHTFIVLQKSLIRDIRFYCMPMLHIFLPTLLTIWALSISYLGQKMEMKPFPVNLFGKATTLVQLKATGRPLLAAERRYVSEGAIELEPDKDIMEYMRNYSADHYLLTDMKFTAAAIFKENNVEALFNNKWLNTAPNSLAQVMNALAFAFVGSESRIYVEMEPLPYTTTHSVQLHHSIDSNAFMFTIILCFSFGFIWTLPLLFFTMWHGSRYGHIEVIAGMPICRLGMASFIYNVLSIVICCLPLNLAIIVVHRDILMNMEVFMFFIHILLAAAFCAQCMNCCVSFCLAEPRSGYLILSIFLSLGIVIYVRIFELQTLPKLEKTALLIWDLHPHFALIHNLMHSNKMYEITGLCNDQQTYQTSVHLEQCQRMPNCCGEFFF